MSLADVAAMLTGEGWRPVAVDLPARVVPLMSAEDESDAEEMARMRSEQAARARALVKNVGRPKGTPSPSDVSRRMDSVRKSAQRRYHNNIEAFRKYHREWAAKMPEEKKRERLAKQRAWYELNRERILEEKRIAYYAETEAQRLERMGKVRATRARASEEKKEERRAKLRAWYAANRDKLLEQRRAKRAAKRSAQRAD